MLKFDYHIPTRILFGAGSINELDTIPLPGQKAMIVMTNGGSVKKLGYLERITELLNKNKTIQYTLFDKVPTGPVNDIISAGMKLYKSEGCDFVIGLGGGSSIDSAKAIAAAAGNNIDYRNLVEGCKIDKTSPLIAVATTFTGTLSNPWIVMVDKQTDSIVKSGNVDTFPILSIVDPELMTTIPAMLTAFQGFSAFLTSAERFISKDINPLSSILDINSLSLINEYLPYTIADGKDIGARAKVAMAVIFAGMSETTSDFTLLQSLELVSNNIYPDIPYGAVMLMISKAYFSQLASLKPERSIALAENMGIDKALTEGNEKSFAFVEALCSLQAACGVYNLPMSGYGMKPKDFHKIIDSALSLQQKSSSLGSLCISKQELIEIFNASYS